MKVRGRERRKGVQKEGKDGVFCLFVCFCPCVNNFKSSTSHAITYSNGISMH